jgi:hypothetical protein
MRTLIVVKASFDEEAGVWTTQSADVPGLRIEAHSVDELLAKLPGAVMDLLEDCEGDDGGDGFDVPIELIAHASTRVHIAA